MAGHPHNKNERMEIRNRKYEQRVENLQLEDGRLHKKFIHQAKPCSCLMCSGENYDRALAKRNALKRIEEELNDNS